ncbi:hypothetical protein EP331_12015 [bacterium]|nr:MAG: hypothetical protein EP331_12015 [bacterium]
MPKTNALYCAYCGNEYQPSDPRERFCSPRCMKLFGTKYNFAFPQSFELSDELSKLQHMIEHTPGSIENTVTKENLIVFYDSIFLQLSRILKWINSQALLNEKKEADVYSGEEDLQKKLSLVLTKVAHLKKENKELKEQLKILKHTPNDIAYQLLGVSKNANEDELKTAFRQKAKQVHPDSGFSDESVFKAIKMAYTLLSAKSS